MIDKIIVFFCFLHLPPNTKTIDIQTMAYRQEALFFPTLRTGTKTTSAIIHAAIFDAKAASLAVNVWRACLNRSAFDMIYLKCLVTIGRQSQRCWFSNFHLICA